MEKANCDFTLNEVISAYGEEGISAGEIKFTDGSTTTNVGSVTITDASKGLLQSNLGLEEGDNSQMASNNLYQNVTENDFTPEFPGDMNAGRKRKKVPSKDTWSITVNRRKRMQGENYTTYKQCTGERRKMEKVSKPARKMGETCVSAKCLTSKVRNCSSFSVYDRTQLFDSFWKDMTWGQKRAYILSMVDHHKVERKTTKASSRREETLRYFLKLNGRKMQVCQKMFLSTLGIGEKQVRNWVKSKSNNQKPKTKRKAGQNSKTISANNFLDSLPKLPSHYCRNDSSKLYLEPIFLSKRQLFRAYETHCKDFNVDALSRKTFQSVVNEKNIGLYTPKKDKCDTCCSFEAGNFAEDQYRLHLEKKESARAEKSADKTDALGGKVHMICMDVQAVKVTPLLNASALYYKTKLVVHNYTVYDMITRNVTCYLWDETEGELVASTFATCLIDFLQRFTDEKPIIIFSDGCTNQNRNAMLSSALLDHAVRFKKTIIQKFLEKGHTQMEVDSVHSAIERKLKGQSVYIPTDYVKICTDSRIDPAPYDVKYMRHSDFLNFSSPDCMFYNSIRPGIKSGDPCVTDIRQLRYNPNGSIDYKLDHKAEWKGLPRKPRKLNPTHSQLYSSVLPLTKRKYQDLMDLLHVLPNEYHSFYKNLPTSTK